MKVGLQIPNFTFPNGPEGFADDLEGIVTTAEKAGFYSIWVMDHFFQLGSEGNILLGPSAEFIGDNNDKRNTKKMMDSLLCEAKEIIPDLPEKATISAYSGIRCKLDSPNEGGWSD